MRKILYISGTRADYGLMRQALFAIKRQPELKIEIAAGGMHLMPEFGNTIEEIKKDGFKIHLIDATYKDDSKEAMANFIAEFISGLTKKIKLVKPDIILVLGDRSEMLAAAVVGAYLSIAVFHLHGGDLTSTVDEVARHAITKLAHIHLAATPNAAKRIIRMGEEPWRVYVVGAPGLDGILNEKLLSKSEIKQKYNLDLDRPFFLVIQHPVTMEINFARQQMTETMAAIKELAQQSIVIYPNADAGGRKMIEVIQRYRKFPFIQIYKSISSCEYLSLMKYASVMVGNSSSGIIEAPTLHLPVVNIGTRQEGRERAGNVIDVTYEKGAIKKAITKAASDARFKSHVKRCSSPYGDGKAGERIAEILRKVEINKKLLQKKLKY